MPGDSGKDRPRLAHLAGLIFGLLLVPTLSPVAPARSLSKNSSGFDRLRSSWICVGSSSTYDPCISSLRQLAPSLLTPCPQASRSNTHLRRVPVRRGILGQTPEAQESSPDAKAAEKASEKPEKAKRAPDEKVAEKAPAPADGPEARLKRIFDGEQFPEGLEDLLAMQARIREISARVIPCTVGVRVRGSQGSGVIVSKDGYVLTAGHVISEPGLDVTLLLHDGRRVKGKTLGANFEIDAGLIKISEDAEWPFVEMGDSASLKRGQWCLSTGHPGGFKRERSAPVRVGRILRSSESEVSTDCTLVGGDSGGPLFDMEGRVIGIHSRIGASLTGNIHVPVGTYKETWERLAKSEAWGRGGPFVGVRRDLDSEAAKIAGVVKGSPAEKAGIEVGDVIVGFDDKEISTFRELINEVRKHKPKDKVKIVVQRGEEKLSLELVIGTRQP